MIHSRCNILCFLYPFLLYDSFFSWCILNLCLVVQSILVVWSSCMSCSCWMIDSCYKIHSFCIIHSWSFMIHSCWLISPACLGCINHKILCQMPQFSICTVNSTPDYFSLFIPWNVTFPSTLTLDVEMLTQSYYSLTCFHFQMNFKQIIQFSHRNWGHRSFRTWNCFSLFWRLCSIHQPSPQ